MIFSFARIGAVVGMRGMDDSQDGICRWFRRHEKGGQLPEVTAHHHADASLHEYVERTKRGGDRNYRYSARPPARPAR